MNDNQITAVEGTSERLESKADQEPTNKIQPSAADIAARFRARAREGVPVQTFDRVTHLESALPLMAGRLASVTEGDSPIVWRTIFNLTLAAHLGWIDRHRGLSDAKIGTLKPDVASSTVFIEQRKLLRELLLEEGVFPIRDRAPVLCGTDAGNGAHREAF